MKRFYELTEQEHFKPQTCLCICCLEDESPLVTKWQKGKLATCDECGRIWYSDRLFYLDDIDIIPTKCLCQSCFDRYGDYDY